MNIEERAAQAAAWKAAGQCNCAQAVLKAFEDKLPVDADTLMKLGAGYAAGMGCMESTCGALIGAVMVAGIVTDGKGTPRISKELLQNFQEKCGATICKELKGIENGAPLFWHWARCWESKQKLRSIIIYEFSLFEPKQKAQKGEIIHGFIGCRCTEWYRG